METKEQEIIVKAMAELEKLGFTEAMVLLRRKEERENLMYLNGNVDEIIDMIMSAGEEDPNMRMILGGLFAKIMKLLGK